VFQTPLSLQFQIAGEEEVVAAGIPPVRWLAGAPPYRSIFFEFFFYRRLPLLLLYLKINSVFTNTQPKSLDLSLIFEFFEEKDEQNHA
jgi:hypothetical protein